LVNDAVGIGEFGSFETLGPLTGILSEVTWKKIVRSQILTITASF